MSGDISREDSDALYCVMVCYGRPSIAFAMLQLWERPWSSSALRYAYHRLHVALAIGCDVLEVRDDLNEPTVDCGEAFAE